ncbi:hypothetical protein PL111_1844 [Leuconostoc inhae]|nr:hypothetical protein PL111_1844 [Leuconostoc inhae]CUW17975.1 hypothetical protein C120C_0975 [Leuconostoc inhae]
MLPSQRSSSADTSKNNESNLSSADIASEGNNNVSGGGDFTSYYGKERIVKIYHSDTKTVTLLNENDPMTADQKEHLKQAIAPYQQNQAAIRATKK